MSQVRRPACSHCGTPLVLRQPHESDYVRLIAVCPDDDCRRWYFYFAGASARQTKDGKPRGDYLAELRVPSLDKLGVSGLDPVPTEAEARASLAGLVVVPPPAAPVPAGCAV